MHRSFASPIDLVNTSRYRIVYVVAYGAVAGEVIELVLNPGGNHVDGFDAVWAKGELY